MPSVRRLPHPRSPAHNYRENEGPTGRAYGACRPLAAAVRGENVVRLAVSAVDSSFFVYIENDSAILEDLRSLCVSEPFLLSQSLAILLAQSHTGSIVKQRVARSPTDGTRVANSSRGSPSCRTVVLKYRVTTCVGMYSE